MNVPAHLLLTRKSGCPSGPSGPSDDADDPCAWLREVRRIEGTAQIRESVDIWRGPVVADVPMKVIVHLPVPSRSIGRHPVVACGAGHITVN